METLKDLRILIIDDNQQIQKDFIKILTMDDLASDNHQKLSELEEKLFGKEKNKNIQFPAFKIDTASQGQEGLQYIIEAKNEGSPYALAFVDIRMPPGWDGIETIKHIWEVDPDIQIVICTAYSDYSWEETVEHLGQRENLLILKKPFDQVAVRQLSMALTKKWQLLRESQAHTKELEKNVKERTKSLLESLSITRGTLESSIDGILVINIEDKILDYNDKLIEMWQIPKTVVETGKGSNVLNHIASALQDPISFQNIINDLMHSEKNQSEKFKCKDTRTIEFYSQPYKLENQTAGRIWSFRDITSRTQMEEKIQFQAMHDTLTKLPNRQLLSEFVHQQITRANNEMATFAVMFFDLDHFKLINDSFSHSAGDELLVTVANRVKENLRSGDMVARLGGDEFVFVISSFKSTDDLNKIAHNLLDKFKKPFTISDHELIISPSIGISIYPDNGKTVDDLIRNADMAMYRAKELGGNQLQFYTTELNNESLKRLETAMDLHRAIENNEFILYYQPQYDLTQKGLISVEALIRWNHPVKGLMLPIDFIPIAEEIGLTPAINEWVLKTACKQNKYWQDQGYPPIRVAVNVTTYEFRQPDLVEKVKNILKETKLKPEYLEIELTENIIISNFDSINKIKELKALGVKIAIDDFGTGYSSLNYLRKIPLDRLKIDQSFIQNIDINRGDEIIIQAIIKMANDLNLEILAEGVESQNQLDFLKSKNCGEIQGFYFSKPLDVNQLENLLKNPEDITFTQKSDS